MSVRKKQVFSCAGKNDTQQKRQMFSLQGQERNGRKCKYKAEKTLKWRGKL